MVCIVKTVRIGESRFGTAELLGGGVHLGNKAVDALAVFVGKHKCGVVSAGDKQTAEQIMYADYLAVLKPRHNTACSVKAFKRSSRNGDLAAEILFILQYDESCHNFCQSRRIDLFVRILINYYGIAVGVDEQING